MLEISLASTNADSSSNLGVVAPVMGDTLVFEATRSNALFHASANPCNSIKELSRDLSPNE